MTILRAFRSVLLFLGVAMTAQGVADGSLLFYVGAGLLGLYSGLEP